VTFGAPVSLADGEDKRDFLARARAAVVALQPVESQQPAAASS
jgi:hypothetical protein